MNKSNINFLFSNVFLNDNESEKDNYNIENFSFFEQLPFIKNSNFTDNLDDKLNNEILNNLEKKPRFKICQIKQIEFTIISTKISNKFLGLKTKRNEDKNNSELNLDNKINLYEGFKKKENIVIEINEKSKNIMKEKKTMMGRKRKDEKGIGNHDKNAKDNMMRKIKSFLLNSINNLLNSSLKDKKLEFLNLDSEIIKNLKKDYNIILLKTTIRDLYENSSISRKYRSKNMDNNKRIIQKIYKDNEEIETIKILNLTYGEFLQIFRRNISNLSLKLKEKIEKINILNTNEYKNLIYKFFYEIKNQELKNNENENDIIDYINNIGKLLINYENWFLDKIGRNRKKR